ncbi:MAG: GAF domain-containing protein, partial [Chloroflexota bacterium]|nr:GAF domain-containing protein [Chloroflexota bacterium]
QLFQILERANQITSHTDLDELLNEMLAFIIRICGAKGGTLYLLDKPNNELIFKAVEGDEESRAFLGQRIGYETGIAGATIQTCEPIIVKDFDADSRWDDLPEQNHRKHQNLISVPLLVQDKSMGVVQVFDYTHSALPLFQFLSNCMASEIEKSLLLRASQQRGEKLEALIAVLQEISTTLDRDQILNLILEKACELLRAEASSLFLLEPESGDLILYIAKNVNQTQLPPLHIPSGTGIIGHVALTGESICLADVRDDERHYKGVDHVSGIETQSLLAVPLRVPNVILGQERGTSGDSIIGGVEVINKLDGYFDTADVQLLETLAEQAATVMHIANLYADADELFLNTIKALVAAIDAKDPYTKGHSQRVSDFSVAVAEEMGLDSKMKRRVRIGALLHDIGKIGVSDAIISKTDRLTEDEWDEIKEHPSIGANIIQQVRLLRDELPALDQHHERMDGLGYPRGLKGEEISIIARIVAVADVFDALTSNRPYRPAMDIQTTLDILQMEAGDHLDPECVDAFLKAQIKGKILV